MLQLHEHMTMHIHTTQQQNETVERGHGVYSNQTFTTTIRQSR